jgi:hypothetical protein
MTTRILAAALGAGAIAAAAQAAPALGADFSLSLSGSSTGVVGRPMLLQATGKNPPPAEYWFPTWLQVDAIPAGSISACPAEAQQSTQFVVATGGEHLAFAHRENPAADGSFTHPVGFTPKQPGRWLICGYTTVTILSTRATASLTVDATSASPPAALAPAPPPVAGARPANTRAPRISRSGGKLVCDPGRWTGRTGGYTYRWFVNGRRKRDADGGKLVITRGLRGRRLTCSVTASNAAGATTAVSRPRRLA